MNFSKVLIGALTAVTLLVVAFVFVINPVFLASPKENNRNAASTEILDLPGEGAPRVAIITPTTLDVVRVKSSADEAGGEADNSEDAPPGPQEDGLEVANAKSEDVATQLLIASIDYLSGNIANELSRTGRLEVVEPLRVNQVIDELARAASTPDQGEVAPTERVELTEEERNGFVSAFIRSVQGRSSISDESEFSGTRTDSFETQGPAVSNASRSESVYRADLAEAAVKLGAKYILVVYVSEPRYEFFRQDIPDTERHVHVIRADPVISYRLFEGVTGTVVLSEVTSPSKPIEIVYEDGRLPMSSAYSEAKLSLERAIAEDIVANIIDTVFPPQISSSAVDLITMDRGTRDGILVGDTFEISRDAGEAVGAGNIRLGERIREPVGSVRVVRVQNTISYVEALTGGPFLRGDYVDVAGSEFERRKPQRLEQTTASGSRSSDEAAPALGARMAAERSQDANKPKLAVRDLDVQYIDCANCRAADPKGSLLAQSMQTQLQNEQRIIVLNRQDLEASLKERDFADSAQGRGMRLGLEGMSSAHFLLSGSLAIAPQTSVSTERVAGREVETGRTTSLRVSGQMRIFDAETAQQIESISVSFVQSGGVSETNLRRVMDRAASLAVPDLMNRLFPLAVLEKVSDSQIEISGGEQAGLRNGARLQVFSVGTGVADLYSDQTSASRIKTGVLVVSDVRRDRATARFSGKPFDIKRGDQLELITSSTGGSAPVAKAAPDSGPASGSPPPKNPDDF